MDCCRAVIAANSARHFRRPAPIFSKRAVREALSRRPNGTVLELGAGALRNARHLQQLGYKVCVTDSLKVRERFAGEYERFVNDGGKFIPWLVAPTRRFSPASFDFAVLTFVLETICQPETRDQLLKMCRRALKPTGMLIISARGISDVVTAHTKGIRCSDGYVTPQKTFIRSYTCRSLLAVLRHAGFASVSLLHKPTTKAPELIHALALVKKHE